MRKIIEKIIASYSQSEYINNISCSISHEFQQSQPRCPRQRRVRYNDCIDRYRRVYYCTLIRFPTHWRLLCVTKYLTFVLSDRIIQYFFLYRLNINETLQVGNNNKAHLFPVFNYYNKLFKIYISNTICSD